MDDERYAGTVRGILTKKSEALDYAKAMADEFVAARGRSGDALSRGAYATLFESKGLLTANDKPHWSTTQITILMETDAKAIERRVNEVAKFDATMAYYMGRVFTQGSKRGQYMKDRKLSDQDWTNLRQEYVGGLDALIERAQVIAARIRGDDATSNTVE